VEDIRERSPQENVETRDTGNNRRDGENYTARKIIIRILPVP
jgi:hypothetical protein